MNRLTFLEENVARGIADEQSDVKMPLPHQTYIYITLVSGTQVLLF